MKRLISLILALATLLSVPAVSQVWAANDNMEIYGLYLSKEGDSTLLKSGNNWLLIDTGHENSAKELIAQLKSYGVKKLDIYISHIHPDHYGGVEAIGKSGEFEINKMYLPDSSIGSEYDKQEYFLRKLPEWAGASSVEYLQKGSTFNCGPCKADVLGPVGRYSKSQFPIDAEGNLTHYLNNYSLTTKFTCGGVSFLSCGDIEEIEEKALCKTYTKGELDADILKLSHHGLPTSNSEEFLAAVTPKHSFALNSDYTYIVKGSSGNMVRQTYTSRNNASAHGFVYMVGDEKQNFGVKVSGGQISVYRGKTILNGWVKVLGGNGVTQKENIYYIKNGETLKGIQTVDGKRYHFSTGGCVIIGYYSNGVYKPWRNIGDGMRAFEENGAMYTGFRTIDGNTFYFDPVTGVKWVGDAKWKVLKIGNNRYALNKNGAVRKNGWQAYTEKGIKNYRYFGTDGAMKTGWFTLGKKKYYMNPTTGYRSVGLTKIGKKKYYFEETKSAAYLRTDCWKKFGKKYRRFDSKGVMETGWVKVGGKYYYFDKSTGYSYTKTGLKTIGGKKYYMQKSSKGSYRYNKSGWKKFGKKYRYFSKKGVVTVGWKKIGKSKYYFDKNGYKVTGRKKIKGKTYKFDANGKLKK